ncbi:MAG: right-handed parallel beta-helix repeat-containing protein, partial [Sphingomonas sp.]
LRIDASAARIGGIVLGDVKGVEISGGTVSSIRERLRYGVNITDSQDVRMTGMTITQAYRGVVINRSERIALVDNRLTGLTSDGIDIGLSRHVLIERNSCRDFSPTFATFDTNGKRVRDGDHPDCIQAWSRPSAPPTSDLTIIGNTAEGAMQGIFLGNHTRKGVNDGGFDRVVVRDNRVTVSMPNGIALFAVRGGEIRDNVVRTVPGAVLPNKRNVAVKAALRTAGNTDVTMCGNVVPSLPRSPGTERCRD